MNEKLIHYKCPKERKNLHSGQHSISKPYRERPRLEIEFEATNYLNLNKTLLPSPKCYYPCYYHAVSNSLVSTTYWNKKRSVPEQGHWSLILPHDNHCPRVVNNIFAFKKLYRKNKKKESLNV